MQNLFVGLPPAGGPLEAFETLLDTSVGGTRIERIVSHGHASPPDFWYDQEDGEWVVVLRGAALLKFAGEPAPHRLAPGDWVNIPPRTRHRVAWTAPNEPTVWLAVHYR